MVLKIKHNSWFAGFWPKMSVKQWGNSRCGTLWTVTPPTGHSNRGGRSGLRSQVIEGMPVQAWETEAFVTVWWDFQGIKEMVG